MSEEVTLYDVIYINETKLNMGIREAIEAAIGMFTMGMVAATDDYDNRMNKMINRVLPGYLKFKDLKGGDLNVIKTR